MANRNEPSSDVRYSQILLAREALVDALVRVYQARSQRPDVQEQTAAAYLRELAIVITQLPDDDPEIIRLVRIYGAVGLEFSAGQMLQVTPVELDEAGMHGNLPFNETLRAIVFGVGETLLQAVRDGIASVPDREAAMARLSQLIHF